MPDFKSFEHNLWGFWQNEKMIKRPRNIYYLAGMSYTLRSICQRMVTSVSAGLKQRLCLVLNILQKWFSLIPVDIILRQQTVKALSAGLKE